MAGMEYTLTGFGDFLERRRVAFVEALPSTRICSVCDVVPSRCVILPCGHVLCQACKLQIASGDDRCPVDGREFSEAAVVSVHFKQSDLEQHRVFCVAGGRDCSFAGRLGDLMEHLVGCCNDKVKCAECQQSVLRHFAVQHRRECEVKTTPQQIMSSTAIASAAEQLRDMKKDLEIIRERASRENADQDAVVNGANSLVERMTRLERKLIQEGRKASVEQRDLLLPAVNKTVVTAGPYRAVSKPGVYMATCKFDEIYAGYKKLTGDKKEHTLSTDQDVLAGYTFYLDCKFEKQGSGDVLLTFILFLGEGDFDDFLEWPFSKKVTIILPHPRDEKKDVRLPVNKEDREMVKKPAPESWNDGICTQTVPWKDIEFHGLVVKDTLYVSVEFE